MDSQLHEMSEPIIGINVTPLVDVSLVLVIIFMIAAPLSMQAGIAIKNVKQEAEHPGKSKSPEVKTDVMIRITDANQILVNEKPVDVSNLPFILTGMLKDNREKMVYIAPGGEVNHGDVVNVMDISKQCGAMRLAIVDPAAAEVQTNGKKP